MPIATLTPKGQVVVPLDIRKLFHLQPGDKLNFQVIDNSIMIKPMKKTVQDAYGILAKSTDKKFSINEIDSKLAKEFRKRKI